MRFTFLDSVIWTFFTRKGRVHFRKAIEIQPDDFVAYAFLGSLTGGSDGDRHLERAVELNPAHLPTWQLRIFSLVRQGRLEEAHKAFAAAEQVLDPQELQTLDREITGRTG